jgi:hypothetical protein
MSAGSGISPNAATLSLVDELRKNSTKYVFALFKVQGTEVIPDSTYPSESDVANIAAEKKSDAGYAESFKGKHWKNFVAAVENSKGPRFGVVDFTYITAEGRTIKQLVSVSYCPDKGTPPREKMTFASTKTAFEMKINVGKRYQANDISDLEFDAVLEYIKTH